MSEEGHVMTEAKGSRVGERRYCPLLLKMKEGTTSQGIYWASRC